MAKTKKTLEEKIEAKKNTIKNYCKKVKASYDEVIKMFYELYEKYHEENYCSMESLVGKCCHPHFYIPEVVVNTCVTDYVSKDTDRYDYKRCLEDRLYDLYCLISGETNIYNYRLY